MKTSYKQSQIESKPHSLICEQIINISYFIAITFPVLVQVISTEGHVETNTMPLRKKEKKKER